MGKPDSISPPRSSANRNKKHPMENPIDIAILTVIPPELEAARRALRLPKSPHKTESGTNYWIGKTRSRRTSLEMSVVLGCIASAGNYDSAAATMEVLQLYKPRIIFLMGIAAGIRGKIKIGEVILSERIVAYEGAELLAGGSIVPRPEIVRTDHSIEQDVASYFSQPNTGRINRIFRRIGGAPITPPPEELNEYNANVAQSPNIKTSTVASGEKLLRDPLKLITLRKTHHGKIQAGEMEAAGFFNACRRAKVPWLVVRGISDFGDSLKNDHFHELASKSAAAALADFIAEGVSFPSPSLPDRPPNTSNQTTTLSDINDAQPQKLKPWRTTTKAELRTALQRYRDLALESCDILDLAGLPEDDRHIAMQKFVMRQLYVPLRVRLELEAGAIKARDVLSTLESRRDAERSRDAGRATEDATVPRPQERFSVGSRLSQSNRLIILGDPGGGKSTLLRWIATAHLLRINQDPELHKLPDFATLPSKNLLPITVRCRDLDRTCLEGPLDDILHHVLRKAELSNSEAVSIQQLLRSHLQQGEAILLIDGLDEIPDIQLRARFCRQLETMAVAYKDSPIVITSRIVGYRQIGFRLGRGFEHLSLGELLPEDKNEFARRWCMLTEPAERAHIALNELIENIHSSDRIERLTGNPMLLTTMALVKRKVGRLPHRRADLYSEAVQVLLNWRREVDEPIDKREALPQLEYIAYEMCRRGSKQLPESELLALLENVRQEYPNIRAITKHSPEQFLEILESRTSIIIQSGSVRHGGHLVPVYEFRHLTFQEYLAGLALIDGRYSGHNRNSALAERISPLVDQAVGGASSPPYVGTEEGVALDENWKEAIRLCIASCNDDDVDDSLLTVLRPSHLTEPIQIKRARSVLAALCLADEPNVSESVAQEILRSLIEHELSHAPRGWARSACVELGKSIWSSSIRKLLLSRFMQEKNEDFRSSYGVDFFSSNPERASMLPFLSRDAWFSEKASVVGGEDFTLAAGAALDVAGFFHRYYELRHHIDPPPNLISALIASFDYSDANAHASAWALFFMTPNRDKSGRAPIWHVEERTRKLLVKTLEHPRCRGRALWYMAMLMEFLREQSAVPALIERLSDVEGHSSGRRMAMLVLGRIGDPRATAPLMKGLQSDSAGDRSASLGALALLSGNELGQTLVSENLDRNHPWIDPAETITQSRVFAAAEKLSTSPEHIRHEYDRLKLILPITVSWT
ncbi:NACHT domain-containing protein [Corallococcus exiguus]|nr:NACHT domain-containing protein [Corallococcus exiguus]